MAPSKEVSDLLTARYSALQSISGDHYKRSYADSGITLLKEGRFTAVVKDGHRVAFMDGRFGRKDLLKSLITDIQEAALGVAEYFDRVFREQLIVPPGYVYEMDIKSDVRWIESNGSTQFSGAIRRITRDEADVNQLAAELRISFDRPYGIIFVKKGIPFFGKNIDLMASDSRRFTYGENYEEIANQVIAVFNEVTAEARATIVALAEKQAPKVRAAVDDSPSP